MEAANPRASFVPARFYVGHHDYITRLCIGKTVLDVGFVRDVCKAVDSTLGRLERSLHLRLKEVAGMLVGIGNDAGAVTRLQARHSAVVCVAGNVDNIERMPGAPFDVIVRATSSSSWMVPAWRSRSCARCLKPHGRFVFSVLNAFGLRNRLRFLAGRYVDRVDHLQTYLQQSLRLSPELGRTLIVVARVQ